MIEMTEGINHLSQMRPYERGFSLISAIFLLVVIAALGTFAVTLSTTQQQSVALDVLGSRAYQAARAGVEWGAFQITQSAVPIVGNGVAVACQSGTSLLTPPALSAAQLSVFNVGVTCSASQVLGDTLDWVYELTSTASGVNGASPGSLDYVERKVRVTIAQ